MSHAKKSSKIKPKTALYNLYTNSKVIVLNNCHMKSYVDLYGNCRCELSLYLKIELILILDFDSESMGLAEKVTSEVKGGKACLPLVLLPLQDLQYVLFFIQSIFRNSSNEFSITAFMINPSSFC